MTRAGTAAPGGTPGACGVGWTMRRFVSGSLMVLASCAASPPPAPTSEPATVRPDDSGALPERSPAIERTVAGVGLPASRLPADDDLWARTEALLGSPAPLPRGGRSSPELAAWREARQEYLAELSLQESTGSEHGPARRVEVRVAAGLVAERLLAPLVVEMLTFQSQLGPETLVSVIRLYARHLQERDASYAACEDDPEADVEWRLLCRDLRRDLRERFGATLDVDATELEPIHRALLAEHLGAAQGPLACIAPPGGPGASRTGELADGALSTVMAMMAAIGGRDGPAELPMPDRLALVLAEPELSPLTAAERAPVLRAVERRARRLVGDRLLSVSDTDRRLAEWRSEHPCPLTDEEAALEALPEMGRAVVSFDCTAADACSVRLTVHAAPTSELDPSIALHAFEADVPDPLRVASWAGAASRMQPPPELDLTELEPEGIAAAIRRPDPRESLSFGEGEVDLAPVRAALAACTVPVPTRVAALWTLAPSGAATLEVRGPAQDCVTAALRDAEFPPGEGERRVALAFTQAPDDRTLFLGPVVDDVRVKLVGPSGSAALRQQLAACHARHGGTAAYAGVSSADPAAEPAPLGEASAEYRQCLAEALRAHVGGCPASTPVIACTATAPVPE